MHVVHIPYSTLCKWDVLLIWHRIATEIPRGTPYSIHTPVCDIGIWWMKAGAIYRRYLPLYPYPRILASYCHGDPLFFFTPSSKLHSKQHQILQCVSFLGQDPCRSIWVPTGTFRAVHWMASLVTTVLAKEANTTRMWRARIYWSCFGT